MGGRAVDTVDVAKEVATPVDEKYADAADDHEMDEPGKSYLVESACVYGHGWGGVTYQVSSTSGSQEHTSF